MTLPTPPTPAVDPDQRWSLRVQGLSKTFQHAKGITPTHALQDVSFDLPRGAILCVLGENGAGKTTLVRILTTLITPDCGQAEILGYNLATQPDDIRHRIGVVFQNNHFSRYLNIEQNLRLHGKQHGLSTATINERLERLLRSMDLWDLRRRPPDSLSGGQQRRAALIRALLHQPQLLFLDEPTTGLDPKARHELWGLIRQMVQEQGLNVILTTHYMEEAEQLSDYILVLHKGRVEHFATKAQFKERFSTQHALYYIQFQSAEERDQALAALATQSTPTLDAYALQASADPENILNLLLSPVTDHTSPTPPPVTVSQDGSALDAAYRIPTLTDYLDWLHTHGLRIQQAGRALPSLEQILLQHISPVRPTSPPPSDDLSSPNAEAHHRDA